jgi:hypothetical protein
MNRGPALRIMSILPRRFVYRQASEACFSVGLAIRKTGFQLQAALEK